jgi:hypothetical protein
MDETQHRLSDEVRAGEEEDDEDNTNESLFGDLPSVEVKELNLVSFFKKLNTPKNVEDIRYFIEGGRVCIIEDNCESSSLSAGLESPERVKGGGYVVDYISFVSGDNIPNGVSIREAEFDTTLIESHVEAVTDEDRMVVPMEAQYISRDRLTM